MKSFMKGGGKDFSASIIVFLVALPLCLGIALGSGAPLFAGIIAGIVGGIVVGSLSGSQLSVSGPAAGLTVIVATSIGKMPIYEAFLLSVIIAGAIQLLFGVLKAGVVGDYIPNCVLKGMLGAIGILLIIKQFPHLIGYDDTDFLIEENISTGIRITILTAINQAFQVVTPGAALIGVLSLLILIIFEIPKFKKTAFAKLIPAPLVVVILGVIIQEIALRYNSAFLLQAKHLVSLPVAKNANEFLGFFTSPDFTFITNKDVWISGVTLAIVASIETLLSIEAVDKIDPFKRVTPANRELAAQGVGNIVSGLIGGIPITSVIVRSSANASAGATSKRSSIFHGILLLFCAALIPTLLNKIPLAALAAILIFTGYKLIKLPIIVSMYKKGWDQFIPFTITIIAIIATDLLIGILIGMVAAMIFIIRVNFISAIMVGNNENNYLIRLRKDVSFLNKPIIKSKLESIPRNSFVIIDTTKADYVDKDIIDVINDYLEHASLKNITVEIKKNDSNPIHTFFKIPSQININ
jgi:MFS superfamily sulfate permease-like transporter